MCWDACLTAVLDGKTISEELVLSPKVLEGYERRVEAFKEQCAEKGEKPCNQLRHAGPSCHCWKSMVAKREVLHTYLQFTLVPPKGMQLQHSRAVAPRF